MLHNEPCSINDCIIDTSAVRLSSYRMFFNVNNDSAFSIYKWNEEVSSRLMKLVGVIEVILRNRIHLAMSEALYGIASGTQKNNDWFNHIALTSPSKDKINKILQKNGRPINPPPSPNFLVSKMTYGFWPNILKIDKKINNQRIEWENVFVKIFPGLPTSSHGFWKKLNKRESVIARCFSVGSLRNRIAHFEPVWKFGDELEEKIPKNNVIPNILNPAPKNKAETITRLSLEVKRAIELLNWLSPTAYADYLNSENNKSLEWLITETAIDTFIKHKEINKISFNKITKARRIKNLSSGVKGCSVITIQKNEVGMLFIYP